MSTNSKLSAADIKTIKRLADEAQCLRGTLLSVDLATCILQEGMLLAVTTFAEDIHSEINQILRRYVE